MNILYNISDTEELFMNIHPSTTLQLIKAGYFSAHAVQLPEKNALC